MYNRILRNPVLELEYSLGRSGMSTAKPTHINRAIPVYPIDWAEGRLSASVASSLGPWNFKAFTFTYSVSSVNILQHILIQNFNRQLYVFCPISFLLF